MMTEKTTSDSAPIVLSTDELAGATGATISHEPITIELGATAKRGPAKAAIYGEGWAGAGANS